MKLALIIEDNIDNSILITKILNHAGYKTLSTDSGIQGYQLALEKRPDFILLDINLPDISGEEILKKIKQDEQIRSTPVIVITSNAMLGDEARLLAAGCNCYIEKPIDPGQIVNQIEAVVGE
jgi:two-component system, cell cycle response regulator DivK